MFSLPNIPGDYAVGATTFALPLHQPQVIGASHVKATNEYALRLEEIAFTAYYPTDPKLPDGRGTRKKGMNWIPSPVKRTLHGYAHFGEVPCWPVENLLHPVATHIKIPVYVNAPLLDPSSSKGQGHQWPLVIFSHGLGGTRTTYSQTCSRIAAMGYVVLAMEHRDGTAPAATALCCLASGKKGCQGHEPKIKYYLIPEKDVKWPDGTEPERWAFRSNQLEFRRLEMYLAYKSFADFVTSESREADTLPLGRIFAVAGPAESDAETFWRSWAPTDIPRVCCEKDFTLMGHSFGGATIFSILSNPPPMMPGSNSRFDALPISHALVLDPWLEPLSSPGPTPSMEAIRGPHQPKILILNSEEFSLWNDHFTRLQQVVATWRQQVAEAVAPSAEHANGHGNGAANGDATAHLNAQGVDGDPSPVEVLTLVRSKHVSFSDFAVISVPPIMYASKSGKKLLVEISELALAFMGDRLHDELRHMRTRGMKVEWVAKRRTVSSDPHRHVHHKRLVGKVGDVVIH